MSAGPRDLGGNARGDVLGKCCGQCGPRPIDGAVASPNQTQLAQIAAAEARYASPILAALSETSAEIAPGYVQQAQAEPVAYRALFADGSPATDWIDGSPGSAAVEAVEAPGGSIQRAYAAPAAQPVNARLREALREAVRLEIKGKALLERCESALAAADAQAVADMARLVDRFLTWPVPADVYPDGTPGKPGRIGTNLLSAAQARAMLEHVLGITATGAKGE